MVGIELRNVTKRFGDTVAVDHVSLDIKRGELFFLLGPSGCGKTTILRMIAGFGDPDEGEICFDGRSIAAIPAHKRNTGMVFQSYALWPHMTVAENVAYGLEERKIPKSERVDRVGQALATVRMEAYGARTPNQLSGGQQQRVALARALVIEPDAVLLDEPLSNLDARLRMEMRYEIRRIHDDTGITMLYVTHDQKEALSMADSIAVMGMGHVEQLGDPRAVYRAPITRFVANFMGEANFVSGRITSAADGWGTIETGLGRFRGRLATDALMTGAEAVCMVRPESLRLNVKGVENAFRAEVKRTIYLGEFEEFDLTTTEGPMRAALANPGDDVPRSGEIDVSFDAEDVVLLVRD